MFVIAVGNAFDGIKLYGDSEGQAFSDHDRALEAAEDYAEDDWTIIEVKPLSALRVL